MKVRVKPSQPEPEVLVEIVDSEKNGVAVISGGYYLLSIDSSGVTVHSGLPDNLGFKLDAADRLVVHKD